MKPILSPWTTRLVCIPRNVASRTTSRHQRVEIMAVSKRPKPAVVKESPWNQQTSPVVIVKAPMAAL